MASNKKSAGLVLYRFRDDRLEVLIARMGGPLWKKKVRDGRRGWSIPKGEYTDGEEAFDAACREFREETGFDPPDSTATPLGQIRQKSGKRVTAWALEGDLDPARASSNLITVEWPPRSGRKKEFSEVDRVEWVDPDTARGRIIEGQDELMDRLEGHLRSE
ncbi:MAG: NUDIX domain-containing protein [Solirubrobacterales bacterium]